MLIINTLDDLTANIQGSPRGVAMLGSFDSVWPRRWMSCYKGLIKLWPSGYNQGMAIAAKKPCRYPGCPTLTDTGVCDVHLKLEQQRYNSSRQTSKEQGYDHTWRKLSKYKLTRDPVCERCGRAAVLVHHRDRDTSNRQIENLESLCSHCHEQEHKADRFQPRINK